MFVIFLIMRKRFRTAFPFLFSEVFIMSDTICNIGSRIIIPQMQDDLKKTLKDLSGLKNLNFATGGCGGISAVAISFCIENNVCPRLTIWLAKQIVNACQDLMPIINQAKKCGAKFIESNCKHYRSGIICRNKRNDRSRRFMLCVAA